MNLRSVIHLLIKFIFTVYPVKFPTGNIMVILYTVPHKLNPIVISNHYQIRPKTLSKFAILTLKSWSHFRILIYRDMGIVELHTF